MKIYEKPAMEIESVEEECIICLSGTTKADGTVDLGDGGDASSNGNPSADVKGWGGSIFDDYGIKEE
jgi:hypothetical protein